MDEWSWEPDDFAALWYGNVKDWMPNLLRYTSRFRDNDQLTAHGVAVRRRLGTDKLETISYALHIVTKSLLRIEILGGTNQLDDSAGKETEYRIIGAHAPDCAAVLHQFTESTSDGRIHLRLCPLEELPARLTDIIPARDPGTKPLLSVHPDDLKANRPSVDGRAPHERYRRLRQGPIHGGGTAVLRTGAYNTNPPPHYGVHWYDLPDGRYLEYRTDYINIRPLATKDLTVRITGWIDRALNQGR